MTFRRRALALLVAGALTFGLAGCFGQPAAKPSTPAPAFTSDAAAYAAAEKTYEGYVEAGNEIDLSDPRTFEPPIWLDSRSGEFGRPEDIFTDARRRLESSWRNAHRENGALSHWTTAGWHRKGGCLP